MMGNLLPSDETSITGGSAEQTDRRMRGVWSPVDAVARLMLVALLVVLLTHAFGVSQDFWAAVHYPYELDYGEGIVWQQAVLIPGPRMYSLSTQIPFVVFHYPPIYYLVAHVLSMICPDLLSAGRAVSTVSAAFIATMVASLVLATTTSCSRPQRAYRRFCALAAGLLIFNVHALRAWAMFMRVDMLAEAIALGGVLIAARSNGRVVGTTCGLLLCVAAVYCKQTELPAGISVFAVTLWLRPRTAVIAGGLALVAGIVPLAFLQWATSGGFLHNIVSDNVNRMSLSSGYGTIVSERSSLFVVVAVVAAAVALLQTLRLGLVSQRKDFFKNQSSRARLLLLVQFTLATIMLFSIFKSGSNLNYFIDWFCVGCVLIGSCLYDLQSNSRFACYFLILLCGYGLSLPFRLLPESALVAERTADTVLVQRMTEASKPVASEDMVLLMRAGKPVMYEPAIVTELTALGHWDERPLISMIASRGFEFMVTEGNGRGPSGRRSAAVAAAMLHAYPIVEQVGPWLWVHLPGQRTQGSGPG